MVSNYITFSSPISPLAHLPLFNVMLPQTDNTISIHSKSIHLSSTSYTRSRELLALGFNFLLTLFKTYFNNINHPLIDCTSQNAFFPLHNLLATTSIQDHSKLMAKDILREATTQLSILDLLHRSVTL